MIVKRIPNVISSPKDSDDFFFDKNGRFVYIIRHVTGENPTFLICDFMFNATIKFIADASIPNLFVASSIWGFLPINTEQIVLTFQTEDVSLLLLLIGFDKSQKSYKILDQVDISNHRHGELIYDDNSFGIFFVHSKVDDSTDVQAGTANYAFRSFKIHANQIHLNANIQNINYTPCKWMCIPKNLYLRQNKLWFVRVKDEGYPVAVHRPQNSPPPSAEPEDDYVQLSYFDLSTNEPEEVCVAKLKKIPTILGWNAFVWVQDCLLMQKTANIFSLFDLSSCEWSPETFDCGINFYSAIDDEAEWFTFQGPETYTMKKEFLAHINEQFVVDAVNKKTGYLNRIPFRQPHKLINIAWFCALNAGLLETTLANDLPYSRVF